MGPNGKGQRVCSGVGKAEGGLDSKTWKKLVHAKKQTRNHATGWCGKGIPNMDSKDYGTGNEREMEGYMYGGVKGRGTPHAMLRVYGVREHLKNNKKSSATYLSDIKKAFDKGNRKKSPRAVRRQF